MIWNYTVMSTNVYTCKIFSWTASTSAAVTFSIQLRNDAYAWYLDDVSIYAGARQQLSNGGFESGALPPWVKTQPLGPCSGQQSVVSSAVLVRNTGGYGLSSACMNVYDQIAQSFNATAGQTYIISFWLKLTGTSSNGQFVRVSIL
jgi:hypothetical protein